MFIRKRTFLIRWTLVLMIPAGGAGLLPGTQPAGESLGDPKAGRNLFLQKGCTRCHSVWGEESKKGPNLASVGMGRNLYDLGASIWSHWSEMNARLEKEQIRRIPLKESEFRDIIAYLYYLNYYREPGDPSQGGEIFKSKGCAGCHAVEPLHAANKPGRPVYEMVEFQGPIALAVAVWNHGQDMYQRMRRLGMTWPQFQEKEVAHLVAFVRARTGDLPQSEMVIPGDFRRGQATFRNKSCSGCHSAAVRTAAGAADLLAAERTASLSSLIGGLWNHFPGMSVTIVSSGVRYPKITKSEMEDLVSYLYWSKAFGLDGSAAAGRSLYDSKQCATCHSAPAGKTAAAPALIGSRSTRSVYNLLSAIWNHGPAMEEMLRERNLPWPTLSGKEMSDLVSYLRSSR